MAENLLPETEAALAEMVRSANGPLAVCGGQTRLIGGARPGRKLSVSGLKGITLYEPGALTMVARAGTPVAEIEAALKTEGQCLPFEPVDHRGIFGTSGTPTIGGAVATGASGPRRLAVGALRDFLLGVRFVDGSGTVVKNGGRVMKNVTGYDLVKLMCGSYGTLGVLSEVSFKVLPAASARATVTIDGLSTAGAVAAMADAMASPFEVNGAAHDPGEEKTYLRLEGFETQVAYRSERLAERLSKHGSVAIERDAASVAKTWTDVRDVRFAHGGSEDLWRISVRPSAAVEFLDGMTGVRSLLDWAGGLVWVAVPQGTDVRAKLDGTPGHATLVRGAPESLKRFGAFQPEPAPVARLSDGLRRRFDPNGVLNPRMMEPAT